MGRRKSPVALLVALWLCQLGTWAAGRPKVNPRIIAAPQGESRAAPRAGSFLPGARPLSTRVISVSFVSSGRLLAFVKCLWAEAVGF